MYHDVTRDEDNEKAPDSAPESARDSGDSAKEDTPKKERVLHTRIPAVLEAELKSAARALRVPVSNLVRTILEDAVTIADRASEKVEDRLSRAAKTVHDERDRIRTKVKPAPLADAIAYQPVVMAARSKCAQCDTALAKGDDAGLVVTAEPGRPRFVCEECMPGGASSPNTKGR